VLVITTHRHLFKRACTALSRAICSSTKLIRSTRSPRYQVARRFCNHTDFSHEQSNIQGKPFLSLHHKGNDITKPFLRADFVNQFDLSNLSTEITSDRFAHDYETLFEFQPNEDWGHNLFHMKVPIRLSCVNLLRESSTE